MKVLSTGSDETDFGGTIHLAIGRAYQDCLQPVITSSDITAHGMDDDQLKVIEQATEVLADGSFVEQRQEQGESEQQVWDKLKEQWDELQEERERQRNDSTVHFDIITDLREDDELSIDDTTILKDGALVGIDGL